MPPLMSPPPQRPTPNTLPSPVMPQQQTKVAILLPLSGDHAALGQSLLQAAQMAVFDLGNNHFTLIPIDTKGTATGAMNAAQSAVTQNAELILGPLFSPSVKAAAPIAAAGELNMIAFSTDWTAAAPNAFILGFTPFDQVTRALQYAAETGTESMAILSPDNQYGRAVTSRAEMVAPQIGITVNATETLPQNRQSQQVAVNRIAAVHKADPQAVQSVLLPLGGSDALTISKNFEQNGLLATDVMRIGTGLLDEQSLADEPALAGAIYAAPEPALRAEFVNKYRDTYGVVPPRVATLAYDAAALSAILAKQGQLYTRKTLLNPNGFFGIDGIFRFQSNGLAERGLAVLQFDNGTIVVRSPAPQAFQQF